MQTELKPCPFCGRKASVKDYYITSVEAVGRSVKLPISGLRRPASRYPDTLKTNLEDKYE